MHANERGQEEGGEEDAACSPKLNPHPFFFSFPLSFVGYKEATVLYTKLPH
jgi:hypothetical protein